MLITRQSTFKIDKLMTDFLINSRTVLQTVLKTATVVTLPVVRPAVGQPDVPQATRITVRRAPVTVSVNSAFSSNNNVRTSENILGYTRQHPPPGLHKAASQITTGQQNKLLLPRTRTTTAIRM